MRLLRIDEFEGTDAIHIKNFRIDFRNLMKFMPAETLTCFEVAGIAEGVLILLLFA